MGGERERLHTSMSRGPANMSFLCHCIHPFPAARRKCLLPSHFKRWLCFYLGRICWTDSRPSQTPSQPGRSPKVRPTTDVTNELTSYARSVTVPEVFKGGYQLVHPLRSMKPEVFKDGYRCSHWDHQLTSNAHSFTVSEVFKGGYWCIHWDH